MLHKSALSFFLPFNSIMKNPCRGWRQLLGAITTILMLGTALSAAGLLGWLFYSLDTPTGFTVVKDFLLQVTGQHGLIVLSPSTGLPVLRGTLGTDLTSSHSLKLRSSNGLYAHATIADTNLHISLEIEDNIQIYTIHWHYKGTRYKIEDCFSLQNALWFAAPSELREYQDTFPLRGVHIANKPLLPSIGIYKRFWLSSDGVGIIIPSDFPVIFSFNATTDNKLCFKGYDTSNSLKLKYKIVAGPDIKHVHAHLMTLLPRPWDIPSTSLFEKPIWTAYPSSENIFSLKAQTMKIHSNGFHSSLLLLSPDYWKQIGHEDSYFQNGGAKNEKSSPEIIIRNRRFMALKAEMEYIKSHGACPTAVIRLRVTPKGLVLQPNLGGESKHTDGLNIRHPAKKRFHKIIRVLHEIGVCAVAMDIEANVDTNAGINVTSMFQETPITRHLHLIRSIVNHTLDEFAHTLLARPLTSPWMSSLILMDDIYPDWDSLGSVLPRAFSLGIAGYPFLIAPALALQNASTDLKLRAHVDAELYIRWFQLVSLFPAVHVNIPPWLCPREVTSHFHAISQLRLSYIHTLIESARQTVHSGLPIIRPIWMEEATTDPAILSINDQFSISHDIIVAPTLKKGLKSRRIYLPTGEWWDTLHSRQYEGQQWIQNYTVELSHIPIFTRMKEPKEEI